MSTLKLSTWTNGKNVLKTIRKCDIVEFNRITYSHYGLYIGSGICVHVQGPNKKTFVNESGSKGKTGIKVAEKLLDIAGADMVRVNNSELIAFQLGVNVRPFVEAIELAISGLPKDCNNDVILGKSIAVTYFLVSSNNCEGWSTYWKYNHPSGWSIQASNGVVHSTIGTIERFSDGIVSIAEDIIKDRNSSILKKASAAAAILPYSTLKYTSIGVKTVTDTVVGGLMSLFGSQNKENDTKRCTLSMTQKKTDNQENLILL